MTQLRLVLAALVAALALTACGGKDDKAAAPAAAPAAPAAAAPAEPAAAPAVAPQPLLLKRQSNNTGLIFKDRTDFPSYFFLA